MDNLWLYLILIFGYVGYSLVKSASKQRDHAQEGDDREARRGDDESPRSLEELWQQLAGITPPPVPEREERPRESRRSEPEKPGSRDAGRAQTLFGRRAGRRHGTGSRGPRIFPPQGRGRDARDRLPFERRVRPQRVKSPLPLRPRPATERLHLSRPPRSGVVPSSLRRYGTGNTEIKKTKI